MDAATLRSLQAPLKEKYKSETESAKVTLKAEGTLGAENLVCKLNVGQALIEAGLHPMAGGTGEFACSGDMLLQSLVACAGVTLSAVATAFGVHIEEGKVTAEGDLDFRGTLGVSKEASVGFTAIRLRFDVKSDAPKETIEKVVQVTERYCVIFQTLKTSPQLSCDVAVTPISQ
eukprot:TRINITY_DN6862_c0_g4_i2.p1 TRINITY_DN6862_c0_g4~~TRINITY_DN6862_c0_g4_i2.p1  ORF type:complete len:174 (-),score=38.33 TRINITY_DN6862_c0_g4_i2:774-1295(-)